MKYLDEEILKKGKEIEAKLKVQFEKIDEICEINSQKVLEAFNECNLQENHFQTSTGYGIDEAGRNKVEEIYAKIFKAEDALVRTQIISGTHALATTLFGILRSGDILLSISGAPYDTLQTVIGSSKTEDPSSLKAHGVKYEEIDLIDNEFDEKSICNHAARNDIKMIAIQKSRGYSTRKSLLNSQLERIIKKIREVNKDVIIMVDNCYGEFVEEKEPIELGADLAVGSLMKNLGGGIATSGGYIVGSKELINLCSSRLVAPSLGKEIGPSFGQNSNFIKGLFFAPSVVASSLKTAIFASKILEEKGYVVEPKAEDKRGDIVQTIHLGEAEKLVKFCQGIQKGSPVDSNVEPYPSDMGGYEDKVIMAAGTFTQGSTIELSCDGPIRAPYLAYMQGGLTYQYGKLGILRAVRALEK